MLIESWRKVKIEQVSNGFVVTLGSENHNEMHVAPDLHEALKIIRTHYEPS